MTKLKRLLRSQGLLVLRTALLCIPCWAAGCATNPGNEALVDPLKQRLLAREDIALQNLLLARTPAYSNAPGGPGRRGGYSYLDAPYDGPAIEPPLPDLNMLPEDMPPWEDFPVETPAPTPEPQPTPMEPVPTAAEPLPPTPTPTPEAAPAETPVPEATVTPAASPTPEPPSAPEPPTAP